METMASDEQQAAGIPPRIGPMSRSEAEAGGWEKRAKDIFNSLPRPHIQPLPAEHAFDLSKYQNQFGCTPAEAWQKCADVMRQYDADSCKAHREEIDTLLVFAGLFSAVVTAFTVESYQWMQNDPNDAIIALLSHIAHPGNQTQAFQAPAGLPDALSARINAYWCLSLSLSLVAALGAILCKQWIREFERHRDQSPQEFISVRQTKLEGFDGWGVASVVAAIPLLLQTALGLFALGMIELLWKLHAVVGIIFLIPAAAALIFYILTTLLPSLQNFCSPFGTLRTLSQCPFKSPQVDISTDHSDRNFAERAATWKRTAEAILNASAQIFRSTLILTLGQELPPPSIPLLPEGQASDFTKYKNRLDFSTADAWKTCAEAIEQHDSDECKAHREEIDTLLVFAGLFSAVLTAFAIESYQWLQDDPNDAIIALLSQLAQAQGFNDSSPAATGLPGAVSARINAYWFLSLTLSLSAALVAILCKQWVREFERHTNQTHRQYVSVRQMKLEGFEGWSVASFVAAIPLLLQSALGLFALGLIELLWNLHLAVAIAVLVPTSAALLFYALTSLLPGLQVIYSKLRPHSTLSQCPFKSPQAILTLRALVWLPELMKGWFSATFASRRPPSDDSYDFGLDRPWYRTLQST